MSDMKRLLFFTFGLSVLAGLALAAALAWITRWWVALVCFAPVICVPLAFLFLWSAWRMLRAVHIQPDAGLRRKGLLLLATGLVLLLQLSYLPIARAWRDWEVQRAQAFLEAQIPALVSYKAQHGEYPLSLTPILGENPRLPALLRLYGNFPVPFDNRQAYEPIAGTFRFRFFLPDGWVGSTYEYCCGAKGRWMVTD